MSFVPGHSYRLSADDSNCLSRASHVNSAPRGLLQGRYHPSAQSFPENAGPYGSGFAGTSVGSASNATHPVLVEAEGSIRSLVSRTPLPNGNSGLCISPGPLEGQLLAKARRDPRHGAQKEDCHDRCFQQELESTVRGQTDLLPLFRRGVGPTHQLPRNASSVSGLSILPAGYMETPCASTLRQQVRGVIHKSPGRPHRQLSLPKSTEALAQEMAQPSALCIPLSRSATAGTQASKGVMAQAYSNSPPLEEPTMVGVIPAAESSPVADPLETGPPLSSERHDMASTARVMGPACVAARREVYTPSR